MKLKCSIVILAILASFLFLVSCQNDSGTAEKQQTKLIESYFQDLKTVIQKRLLERSDLQKQK